MQGYITFWTHIWLFYIESGHWSFTISIACSEWWHLSRISGDAKDQTWDLLCPNKMFHHWTMEVPNCSLWDNFHYTYYIVHWTFYRIAILIYSRTVRFESSSPLDFGGMSDINWNRDFWVLIPHSEDRMGVAKKDDFIQP